jgi:pimeloyl-ACP methyl ester carboxylesterase
METKFVPVDDGKFNTEILEGGSGSPLLLMHGWTGIPGGPFLDELAKKHRVIAPRIPGFGESSGDDHLTDFFDLLYYHLDLLDALDLRGVPVIAHSLGAMIAAEIAAMQPDRFSKLILVAPFGIWNEAHPVLDFFIETPQALSAAMYANPDSDAAKAAATIPDDEAGRVAFFLERAKSLRIAAKYLWPIPNRGLSKRAHRISTPTLLIWGENDGISPPELAKDFQAAIKGSKVEIIPGAGHLPGVEKPQEMLKAVEAFIG